MAVHPANSQTKQQQTVVRSHGSHAPPSKTEVVHTTQKHPWLTTKGWITAGHLHLGNEVQLLDGLTATVVGLKIVPGMAAMYDLTVSNIHTFAVGDGQFVVHNCLDPRVQYVRNNLDTLVPEHGGGEGTILLGDELPKSAPELQPFAPSIPDIITPKAVIEVTGAELDGSVPSKLLWTAKGLGRGIRQLMRFVDGASPEQKTYLLYEGDTSLFPQQLHEFLNRFGVRLVQFSTK